MYDDCKVIALVFGHYIYIYIKCISILSIYIFQICLQLSHSLYSIIKKFTSFGVTLKLTPLVRVLLNIFSDNHPYTKLEQHFEGLVKSINILKIRPRYDYSSQYDFAAIKRLPLHGYSTN